MLPLAVADKIRADVGKEETKGTTWEREQKKSVSGKRHVGRAATRGPRAKRAHLCKNISQGWPARYFFAAGTMAEKRSLVLKKVSGCFSAVRSSARKRFSNLAKSSSSEAKSFRNCCGGKKGLAPSARPAEQPLTTMHEKGPPPHGIEDRSGQGRDATHL